MKIFKLIVALLVTLAMVPLPCSGASTEQVLKFIRLYPDLRNQTKLGDLITRINKSSLGGGRTFLVGDRSFTFAEYLLLKGSLANAADLGNASVDALHHVFSRAECRAFSEVIGTLMLDKRGWKILDDLAKGPSGDVDKFAKSLHDIFRGAADVNFRRKKFATPIEVDAVSLANILNNPSIVTASGSEKTFKPQEFLDLIVEVKPLDIALPAKVEDLNAGRLLSQERGRAGLLKLIDNKSASGSTGNFLELLVVRGFMRGDFSTNGKIRELKGFRVALGRSDIDHIILENGQEFVVQTKLSGAAWDSYEHFVNWAVASNKAIGKTVNEKDPVELWKSVRVAMPNVDEIPPKILEKLGKKLDKELPQVRQWLKDQNIVIDVSSVYD